MKAWTLENWERWEEEKPAFFNDAFKASVDDDMIPAASLRKLHVAGSSRRRSSLGEALGYVVEDTVEEVNDDLDAAIKTVRDMVSSLRLDVDARRRKVGPREPPFSASRL